MKTFICNVSLAAAIALIVGCATASYEKAGNTSTSLQKAAQRIDKGNAQIVDVLATLSDLVNNPGTNLERQFKKFDSSVDELESLAKDVEKQAAQMQKQGADYFQNWDSDLANIHNEDIRKRSLERKNAVAARFDSMKARYLQARTDFDPFLSDLRDVRTALSADLTVDGLATVKGAVSKANQDVIPLRESLEKLSADFKALGVSLSAKMSAR